MRISSRDEFIDNIKAFNTDTKHVVIKPNWVSNQKGEYTEPEILEWLFRALPQQKKIVIESYTPWRGLKLEGLDDPKGLGVSLAGGKNYWDFYKKQDSFFLESTGIGEVLAEYGVNYVNITNEVWEGNCVKPKLIKEIVESKGESVRWEELYSYIPQKLHDIRNSSTLISLSKIKVEESIPAILVSMSIKNLFGLIPHPSRWVPFHEKGHTMIPEAIRDVYTVYTSLFSKTLWITEGVKSLIRNYCEPNQKIITNKNLFFIGAKAKKVDSEACLEVGIDPKSVAHLQLL